MQREEKIWLFRFQKEEYWCCIGFVGESRNDGVHHHADPTTFRQWRKTWLRPFVPTSTSAAWWATRVAPLIGGYSSTCPPMSTPWSTLRELKWYFLKKRVIRCEVRVASSRTRFRERLGERQDEGYKENTQIFWKVLRFRR